jgi:oligopeptide transport system permease protein
MLKITLGRLGQGLVVLLVLYSLTFILVRTLPGDPFMEEKAIPEYVKEKKKEAYGLNDSLPKQYVNNLGKILKGDFGYSTMMTGRNVSEIIGNSFPVSLKLGIAAIFIALLIGIPSGVIAAARKNTSIDFGAMAIAMIGICLPSFVIGPILATWIGQSLKILPAAGWDGFFSSSIILPALTLGLISGAYLSRLTRAGMLDVLGQDYIRTAKAKGLKESTILMKHALKTGMIPAVAYLGPAFAGTVSGSIVIEQIFHVPGMGQQFINAINKQDPFLIQGCVLLYGSLIVIANLVTDILQTYLNPRLRKG